MIEYACKPDVENFAKVLSKYVWLGTRDTTMVLMVTMILALAEKCKEADFRKYLDEMDTTLLINLFHAMGQGDGATAKNKLAAMKSFKYLFVYGILSQAIKPKDDSEKSKDKANKECQDIWSAFVNQVGKIKKWKISHDTVENNVMPILYKVLPKRFAKAFTDGFNGLDVAEETEFDEPTVERAERITVDPTGYTATKNPPEVNKAVIDDIKKVSSGWRIGTGAWKVDFDQLVEKGSDNVAPTSDLDKLRAFERGLVEEVGRFSSKNAKPWAQRVFNFYKQKFGKGDPFTKEMYDFMKKHNIQITGYHE